VQNIKFQQTLQKEFLNIKARNPSFSMRAFARKLGVQPSALCEILNNKRIPSKKMVMRIATGLGQNSLSETYLNHGDQTQVLSIDQYKLVSDWHHFAILSLMELRDFQSSIPWIAKRLNIANKMVKESLVLLKKNNLVIEDEAGNFSLTGKSLKTSTDIVNDAIKAHTIQALDLAREALLKCPIEKRDYSTVTMAIDVAKIPEAKEMIKKFRKKLMNKLESGNKNEVYKVAIQLFPLSAEQK
jgi:transcriptional regulator with XRE-family HTH domain